MRIAETWRGRFAIVAAGVATALVLRHGCHAPTKTVVIDEHPVRTYSCPSVASPRTGGYCLGNTPGPIRIDAITATGRDENPVCFLMSGYAAKIEDCVRNESVQAHVEFQIRDGITTSHVTGSTPAINRCIEHTKYKLVGYGADVDMSFDVTIPSPPPLR